MTWHWGAFVIGFLTWPALSVVAIALLVWAVRRHERPRPRPIHIPSKRFRTLEEIEADQPRFRTLNEIHAQGHTGRAAIEQLLKEVGGR